jgi:hypothetical protein
VEKASSRIIVFTYGAIRTDVIPSAVHGKAREIDPELRRKVMYAGPALAIGIFLASADQTIVVSSYGRIGSEMKALHKASWIATAYTHATSPGGTQRIPRLTA